MLAYFRAPLAAGELAKRTLADTIEDGVPGLAAQLAFYFLLAVFPALLFLISLLAYLPVQPAISVVLARLDAFLPTDVIVIVREHVAQILTGDSGGVMTLAVAGAIWSSSTAMTAIISALNHAYDIEESRPWWRTRLLAVALTLALSLFVALAFALVVGGTDLGRWMAGLLGAGEAFAATWTVTQWPVAFALVVFAVDLVYHVAPNRKTEWVWITPGSLLATALWLAASAGFKIYVQNFGNYVAVYGAIGSVIVLMLWFYLSGFALLVGAELNAEIDKAVSPPESGGASDSKKKIGPEGDKAGKASLGVFAGNRVRHS
jgi:membrane protein